MKTGYRDIKVTQRTSNLYQPKKNGDTCGNRSLTEEMWQI